MFHVLCSRDPAVFAISVRAGLNDLRAEDPRNLDEVGADFCLLGVESSGAQDFRH